MGRITGSVARRRVLIGVVAIGALALGACAGPLKPAPEPDGAPALPNIQLCAPGVASDAAQARVAPGPGERPCVPFCLPGQEPTPPEQSPFIEPAPEPEVPSCVPICPPDEGGGAPPDQNALRAVRCVTIPRACLPGEDPLTTRCVQFCLPGEEPARPEASAQLFERRCVPLCALAEIIRGFPGLEPCEVPQK